MAFSLVVLGCAPQKPPAFVEARAQAERHYAHGRYEQAALAWQEAAQAADRARDREEAMYRVATSRERAGDLDGARAAYRELSASFPEGSHAPRVAYELANFELLAGQERGALELYARMIEQYPQSGLAGRALDRCLVGILRDAEVGQKLLFLTRFANLEKSETAEKVGFLRAKLFYEQQRLVEAKREFLRVAAEYPYPYGGYWDDALWYAADAERRLGNSENALSLLERMLNEREPAHFQGSYQRPRYAEAQFRIAEIYRDDLDQPEDAMRAFHDVFTDHPTSLLRDDALWQEARIAHERGQASRACHVMDQLVQSLPDSRFAACANALCESAKTSETRCRRYILRELEIPAGGSGQARGEASSDVQSSK